MSTRPILVVTLLAAASPALAGVQQVDPATLTTADLDGFEDFEGGPNPGVNHDVVLVGAGFAVGERLAGQEVVPDGTFDTVTGAPTYPLALAVGAPGQNLTVFEFLTGNVLAGNGPVGFPEFAGVGEGAIAILFDTDQDEVGFEVAGANEGTMTVQFVARTGAVIDTLTIDALASGAIAFRRDEGTADIAAVVITNDDEEGIAIDHLRYDAPASCAADLNGDGFVGVPDLLQLLAAWGSCR